MSVISDSRRPARQALGQVVVRLSALRFANCAPVACYGCADQALFQCLFLIYLFYHSFSFFNFPILCQIGLEWILLVGLLLPNPPLSSMTGQQDSRHILFSETFLQIILLGKEEKHLQWLITASAFSRFSNEGNRNLKDE